MSKNSTEHINQSMNDDVAKVEKIPAPNEVEKSLVLDNNMAYIGADAYVGNPYALLGNVIEVRKAGGSCPPRLNSPGVVLEFSSMPISGIVIDEASKIKEPIKRQSITVDQNLSMKVAFLTFLSAQLDSESSFSVMVFDQAAGLIATQDPSWKKGLTDWKEENKALWQDDEICYLFGIVGFVQKYVIYKKFKKFTAGAKGGAYGVNLEGNLYTSSEDYSLDIRFGLQPVILKRPSPAGLELAALSTDMTLSNDEIELFKSLPGLKNIQVKKAALKPVITAALLNKVSNLKAPVAAAEEKTTLDTVYTVNNSGNQVTLEINAGAAGQTSDMTIMLDETVIVKNHAGNFSQKVIGTNSTLDGKKLSIVANIADTSKQTNLTSITIHIRGGLSPVDLPLSKTVAKEGDSVDYLCLIEFFNPA